MSGPTYTISDGDGHTLDRDENEDTARSIARAYAERGIAVSVYKGSRLIAGYRRVVRAYDVEVTEFSRP